MASDPSDEDPSATSHPVPPTNKRSRWREVASTIAAWVIAQARKPRRVPNWVEINARKPKRETVETAAVVMACLVSIAQWWKIGENDEQVEQSIRAAMENAEATRKIANAMERAVQSMASDQQATREIRKARVVADYEPFDPASRMLRIRLTNLGPTTARDVEVFAAPKWDDEPPMGMVANNPPPPFDIEPSLTVPYPVVFADARDGSGKVIPTFGPLREGEPLRMWHSIKWFDIFGRWNQIHGCLVWRAKGTGWQRCDPATRRDWFRIYKQNGASDEDARRWAEQTEQYQAERLQAHRAREIIR